MRAIPVASLFVSFALVSCSGPASKRSDPADAIYFGGDIITVSDADPEAEAIAIKDGRILFVGSKAKAMELQGDSTAMHDLQGRTLIPGFVDAHSHMSQVGVQAISANLLPPPDGPATSIPQIQEILRSFMATSSMVKDHGILIGFDYDDSQLVEHRHPTRQELDAVSTEIPVFVIHQSGHLGV